MEYMVGNYPMIDIQVCCIKCTDNKLRFATKSCKDL